MRVDRFAELLGADFYTGVPDSQLKALCNYLMDRYGTDPRHHVIAANEGNCAALAAGYHLATGKVPVVYLQNSGEGNIINPAASLLSDKVYAIPVIFVVGWRGEPGVHDEPQHVYQGMVTLKLLEDMDIAAFVVSPETAEEELAAKMQAFRGLLAAGKDVAFVIRKGALTDAPKVDYRNQNAMTREEIIRHIVRYSGEDPIVSTTGKASRELFEIREAEGRGHGHDFLTVGSMGHASSIALGIALQRPDLRVWCVDGDGAALMHMGAMAVIGANRPRNLIRVGINTFAHGMVGGMPTAAGSVRLAEVARACGYARTETVGDGESLDRALAGARAGEGPVLIEALCAIGARADLGRPTATPQENKAAFMRCLEVIRRGE